MVKTRLNISDNKKGNHTPTSPVSIDTKIFNKSKMRLPCICQPVTVKLKQTSKQPIRTQQSTVDKKQQQNFIHAAVFTE